MNGQAAVAERSATRAAASFHALAARLRKLGWTAALLLFFVGHAAAQSASPQRIVSAAPSITEMLYDLGLGERVVGVTTFCHYPPEVREKPKIGTYLRPNVETILAMRPDLIVVLQEHTEMVSQFRSLGLPVLPLQHNDLEGIYESMLILGRRTGVEDVAARRVMEIRHALEAVRKKTAGLPRRTVMFLVGRSPSTVQDMIAVGHGSFLNELIDIAGGENLFGKAAMFYPRIPREEVYARRPDVIVDMGDMSDTDRVTDDHRRAVGAMWRKKFPTLPAVSEGRVYPVANDIFVVPGPRVVEAARELLAMIHPEATQ